MSLEDALAAFALGLLLGALGVLSALAWWVGRDPWRWLP